ncbi:MULTISPECIES: hypothetical protein [Rodentibacter]|uniref:hypothetical protein n=1 Tax=Rodentibacter TaxID=1960084 RepID=UPI001094E255|nr:MULTISPECIES: hypothetical protein [Pasteurellaceae]MCR1838331.1 hypothetical protein [Pasteurella caecimuris]MCU0107558.1 hypothetical protein [Pasteurella caecimuris]NBH76243.1 hypothetical protein [Rodentibacter pneumotropicus]TGY49613.1 hypothetical protein E5343_06405 [Pasteurella caecimuris]THA07154.1 hypothetical protein D3M73_03075 [Rodentibacter pneumotropicus]
MTQHYLVMLSIEVESNSDDLTVKVGIDCKSKLPHKVLEIVRNLMATIPVVITKGWNEIIKLAPEVENGFVATLHFDFFLDEEREWAVSAHTEQKEGIEPLLMGMSKMIFTDDPVIQELLERDSEILGEPKYIQHFDPTC